MTKPKAPAGAISLLTAQFISIFFFVVSATSEVPPVAEGATDVNSDSSGLPPLEKLSDESIQCPVGRCSASSRRTSLYDHGGSAQAYKPSAPVKSVVCDAEVAGERRYRVASWPLRRASYKSGAPHVEFRGRIWSCPRNDDKERGGCAASPLSDDVLAITTIEVWQARPDGSYSSLAPGYPDGGECRSTLYPRPSSSTDFRFDTVAPGSPGSLGGLGPSGYDFPPYGPPAIHVLIRAPGFDALLVDVVIMPEGRTFRGGEWSGHGWIRSRAASGLRYEVSTSGIKGGSMTVEADFFLRAKSSVESGKDAVKNTIEEELCQSRLYGLRPKSFFTEPITLCAPSLLDYFGL